MRPYQLTSDVLEAQFGTVHADILQQTATRRVMATRSDADGRALELAVVSFNPEVAGVFGPIHAEIVAGGMMGKTFRAHGVQFERRLIAQFTLEMPQALQKFFGSSGQATVMVADMLVGDHRQAYSRNIEIYTPAVRWPAYADSPQGVVTATRAFLHDFLPANATLIVHPRA